MSTCPCELHLAAAHFAPGRTSLGTCSLDFSEKVTFLSLTRPPPHGAPLRARQGPLRAPVRRVPRQGRRGVVIRAEHRTCYARASPGNQGGLSGVSRRTGGWARLCYVSFFLFFFGRRGQHGSRVEVRLGLCADVVAELYKVCREFRAGVELEERYISICGWYAAAMRPLRRSSARWTRRFRAPPRNPPPWTRRPAGTSITSIESDLEVPRLS